MNLYRIYHTENRGYDTYDSAIVCAESEEEAILWHPNGTLNYSEDNRTIFTDRVYGSWVKKKYVKVVLLGKANDELIAGVILASFNAG